MYVNLPLWDLGCWLMGQTPCLCRVMTCFLHCVGVNITLVDKNGRTVFDVLDQYPTKRSQDIKDIIVGTSHTSDRELSSMMGDSSHDDEGISSVNNPVYDSAANALGEEGMELLRIPLSDRFSHLPKQTVCAVARVDYYDSCHSEALRLRVGDRMRVIGHNSNGTWTGVLGGTEGNFFASHVDFYEGEQGEGRRGLGVRRKKCVESGRSVSLLCSTDGTSDPHVLNCLQTVSSGLLWNLLSEKGEL